MTTTEKEAAIQAEKERDALHPAQREVLDRFMAAYPDISLPESLRMLKEAGG
jgi:hypothetical protein